MTLNPPQQRLLAHGLLDTGFSWVLEMPTASGKTWLAERAIEQVLTQKRRAIYLTPLRALASELLERWRPVFSGHTVGVFTGEPGRRKSPPVAFADAQLLIMTPERLDACTRSWRSHWSWIPDVDLLVVDELHLLADRTRGARLEGAISRIRRLNPFLRILGLSATLGNPGELADWLEGVDFRSTWRAVPLSWRCETFKRANDKPSILTEVVSACTSQGGRSLVFVQSRRRAEFLARCLIESGLRAAHHHAGLEREERQRTETDLRQGRIDVVVCTGTLEMGLNLPVRQVVLYDLQHFDGSEFRPLPVSSVLQRGGRAGRPGLDPTGEVVLLVPAWDRSARDYPRRPVEPVLSQLAVPAALAEQVLAEVASGMTRTQSQLGRALLTTLAARQNRLPSVGAAVTQMLASGMLSLEERDGKGAPKLRATRLGRIAVRHMVQPETVLRLAQWARSEHHDSYTFLDLILIGVSTSDFEPLLPVDFEELEDTGARLGQERSLLLTGRHSDVLDRLGLSGRHLLACLRTALALRHWTRAGDVVAVADEFACYPFEVGRMRESLERILACLQAILDGAATEGADAGPDPSTGERCRCLRAMVSHGLDERAATLTFVSGIGGVWGRKLHAAGVADIEDLALADEQDLVALGGLSSARASKWIEGAAVVMKQRSARALEDQGPVIGPVAVDWPPSIDPYRLRRALELCVEADGLSAFVVSGGLEPHRVGRNTHLTCDCADSARGVICKHVLAVQLFEGHAGTKRLARRLQRDAGGAEGLDVFALWTSGRQARSTA